MMQRKFKVGDKVIPSVRMIQDGFYGLEKKVSTITEISSFYWDSAHSKRRAGYFVNSGGSKRGPFLSYELRKKS